MPPDPPTWGPNIFFSPVRGLKNFFDHNLQVLDSTRLADLNMFKFWLKYCDTVN